MDKIVKEEVITLYVSQVAMLLVCLVCTLLPLYMHPVMTTGWKAVIGLVLFCVVLALNVSIVNEKLADWFMKPAVISYSAFRSVLDKMEHKARLGTLAQEDYDNWWNRGLSTFDWFARVQYSLRWCKTYDRGYFPKHKSFFFRAFITAQNSP